MSFSPVIPSAIKLLRQWGVTVTVNPRADDNGRPASFAPRAVMLHHTGSSTASTAKNSLRVIASGRPGVPGPLAQFFVSRSGVVHCVTYGRANHGGVGGPWRNVPKDQANACIVGIELDNNGAGETYSPVALRNARHLAAALLVTMKRDASSLLGHKEWAPGRKIDPRLAMDAERSYVARIIRERMTPKDVPAPSDRYTVKPGDTLWDIAERRDTSAAALAALNGLKDADQLQIGQVLRMPANARYHQVRPGDTLTSIAEMYHVTIDAIARNNRIGDLDVIQVGDRLRIPRK